MSNYLTTTGLAKNASVAAMALLTLAAGIFFAIKAGNNNNAYVQQWQTQDGRVKAHMTGSGTLTLSGSLIGKDTVRFSSGMIMTRSTDIGWSVQAVANQACNTTCVNACVFGEDTSVLGTFVSCADATADRCLCAGGS